MDKEMRAALSTFKLRPKIDTDSNINFNHDDRKLNIDFDE